MERIAAKRGFLPGLLGEKLLTGSQLEGKHSSHHGHRWDLLHKLPDAVRTEFVAMAGEFVGTFLFLFFAFSGTQVANTATTTDTTDSSISQGPNPAKLLYIALSFGFSLAVNAWVFYRVTGGLFNPAVSQIIPIPHIGATLTYRS